MALTPGAQPRPIIATAAHECCAFVSPDGKWISFNSNESGGYETYVARYPDGGAKTQVTFDSNAFYARWSSANELIVMQPQGVLRITLQLDGDTVRASPLQRVFTNPPGVTFTTPPTASASSGSDEDQNDYTKSLTLVTAWNARR